MTSGRGVRRDVLSIAAIAALAIVTLLYWSVAHFAGLPLPLWYWALGDVGMTAAIYAQLMQRRDHNGADTTTA
jgi:hypothetical protein